MALDHQSKGSLLLFFRMILFVVGGFFMLGIILDGGYPLTADWFETNIYSFIFGLIFSMSIFVNSKLPPLNEEIREYTLKAYGMKRSTLNIVAFFGIFIFGWLIAVIFSLLGKKRQGWKYLIPIIFFSVLARRGWQIYYFLAPTIYIIAWIHSNITLSRFERLAKSRIKDIEQLSEKKIDTELERGILLSIALHETNFALSVISDALKLTSNGEDPLLFNKAGIILFKNKQYEKAKDTFNFALKNIRDESLKKQIAKNRLKAMKKLDPKQ